jgi:predicted dehydrogenase
VRCAVVGCGSIGLRHLRNLRTLGISDIAAVDTQAGSRERASAECGAAPLASIEDALAWSPDVVFVTTPTHLHLPQALAAAHAGCHLFVEKPLSDVEDGLDELVAVIRARNLTTMVACNMRFHHGPSTMKRLLEEGAIGRVVSVLIDAGQYLPDWHPGEDYRLRYSANRSMGGGIVLDGIHELDYARWLLGEVQEVFCYGGKRSRLAVDVEDAVEMLLRFESGATAAVHLDYLQRAYARSCKIIGEDGTIHWDIACGVRVFTAAAGEWLRLSPPEGYALGDMYLRELEHFLACVAAGSPTTAPVGDAARVTRIALAAKRSMAEGVTISV